MASKEIPRATAKRLPLYNRTFKLLSESGQTKISSSELSDILQIDSATIRRDFSHFGTLGKRGYGYDVDEMAEFFSKMLNHNDVKNFALIGVGNLGGALLNYNGKFSSNINIVAGFDLPEAIKGEAINNIPIFSIDSLEEKLEDLNVDAVILTVPAENAQDISDRVIEKGVKGIVNFTPARVLAPDEVTLHQVDLTNEIQTFIYFMDHYN